jgi:hypothetical protein
MSDLSTTVIYCSILSLEKVGENLTFTYKISTLNISFQQKDKEIANEV